MDRLNIQGWSVHSMDNFFFFLDCPSTLWAKIFIFLDDLSTLWSIIFILPGRTVHFMDLNRIYIFYGWTVHFMD